MEKSEVICISSEEEEDEDVRQSGGIIAEASSSRTSNTNHSTHLKMDIALESEAKAEVCTRKRTSRQANDKNDHLSKKRTRLSPNHDKTDTKENSIDVGSNESEHVSESNGKQQEIMLKPKLVEKKRKVISDVVQDTFPMFISLCLQKDHTEDMKCIVNRLKRRYEQLDPAYANSENFTAFLNEKRNEITNSEKRLYVYISDVMNEMKSISKGTSTLLVNRGYSKTNVSHLGASTSKEGLANDDSTEINSVGFKEDSTKERQIRLLEESMKSCEKRIKKLEETEINFADENNSDYIKLERYKQRMVDLYNKYCELTGSNPDAERSYLRPKHFKTTGIDAVDMAISSFINSNISKRQKAKKVGGFTNALIFPDYRDILQCVEKCNEGHNLGLDEKTQKQIAKKAFTDLGQRLQRARREDFLDTFSLLFEENDEDPAVKDPVLADKLMQSKKEGEVRLRNVFEEYVKKQEETKDQMTEDKSSDNDQCDDSSESEAESCDADDNISECSSVGDENAERDSDGSSGDISSLSINDIAVKNKDSAGNANIDNDLLETDRNSQRNSNVLCTSDTSNGDYTNRLKSNNTVCAVNARENNPKSQVQKTVNDVISPHAIVSSDVTVSARVTDTVSTGRTEEGEPKILCDDSIDNTPLEEDKPLLRVRSFAKPPTTWQDGRQRADELTMSVDGSAPKVVTIDANIDLTNETRTQSTVISKYRAVQVGAKILPALKRKYGTLMLSKSQNIIKVQNLTNNYVRLNSQQTVDRKSVAANQQRGQMMKSRQVVHIQSDLSAFAQTANATRLVKSTEVGKQNSVIQIKQFK